MSRYGTATIGIRCSQRRCGCRYWPPLTRQTMRTIAVANDDHEMSENVVRVYHWQRGISDHTYRHPGPERIEQQQRLIRAATQSCRELLDVICDQSGIAVECLSSMPQARQPITARELDNRNWVTDWMLREDFSLNPGRPIIQDRRRALDYKWWHLFMLRMLQDRLLPDPPICLITTQSETFQNSVLREDLIDAPEPEPDSPDPHRKLDGYVRNLLRRSGGIHHRSTRHLVDAPLARGWWLAELARAANQTAQEHELSTRDLYEALKAAGRNYTEKAAVSATRLAHPHCVAAYALAAQPNSPSGWLSGQESVNLIESLMRRTGILAVDLVDPADLAALAQI